MLEYEERRHDESTTQVSALERAFKRSSEGRRLNKLIREKNVVGAYMNAAEGLASEAKAALRKARKYTDAAGGKLPAAASDTKRKHQTTSSSKQKCPAEVLITSIKTVFIGSTLTLIRIPRLSSLNPQQESGITTSMGDGISESATCIP